MTVRRADPPMTAPADDGTTGRGERAAAADEFLTVGNLAERLRVHPQTVRTWIARGDLRAIRIGRTVRVRQPDFEEMLERARIPPPTHSVSPHPGRRAPAGR
jgi:excisionase family DNA binding protein